MDNKALLKVAALFFRDMHPGITPEAVLCFLVIANEGAITVSNLMQTLRYDSITIQTHLNYLTTSSGLIAVDSATNTIHLSAAGAVVANTLQQRMAASA